MRAAPEVTADRERLLRRLAAEAMPTGHELIARTLARQGITHVFGVSGVPTEDTLAACARAGLRVVGARHQQGAVLMAAGFNYVSGGLRAAVIVSMSVAVTNCATGLLVARDNHWPLLVIGAQRDPGEDANGAFQAFDSEGFCRPLVKRCLAAGQAGALEAVLDAACAAVGEGLPGPVYVDVREGALTARVARTGLQAVRPPATATATASASAACASPPAPRDPVDALAIADVLEAMRRARRPVVRRGARIRGQHGWDDLAGLVDAAGLPFAATPMARGFVPDDHPLCFSEIRGPMLAQADLVLLVGARFDWTLRFGCEVPPDATVIRLGADAGAGSAAPRSPGVPTAPAAAQQRTIDREVPGDPAAVLHAVRAALSCGGGVPAPDAAWLAALVERRAAARTEVDALCASRTDPPSPYAWLRVLRDALPASVLTVLDGNVVMSAAQRVLPVRQALGRMTPGHNGCMGVGIPFAIGAKLATPTRPVVAVVGDFAFGLTAMELETAVRLRVPIVVLVARNGGLGGTNRQHALYGPDHADRVCVFAPAARADGVMTALGGTGVGVASPEALSVVLATALAADGPTCIDVATDAATPLAPVT